MNHFSWVSTVLLAAVFGLMVGGFGCSMAVKLPEEGMNASEIITYYGYPYERHHATTKDGYILTLIRIRHGKNNANGTNNGNRVPVFLMHGLGSSCQCWLTNLPHQSLAYILADAGFDVWMGNVRGNGYSRDHVSLSPSDKKFWDFTWEQMSEFDLPAMVEKALAVNGAKKLYYIGHSQGTLMAFTHFSANPEWTNEHVETFYALAPVYTVGDLKAPLKLLAPFANEIYVSSHQTKAQHPVLPKLWQDTGSENGGLSWITKFIKPACDNPLILKALCTNFVYFFYGPEVHGRLNETRLMVYVGGGGGGTSMKNMLHWSQLVNSGKCQEFSYGDVGNYENYHCIHGNPLTTKPCPPQYHVKNLKTDTVIYWSLTDEFADEVDAFNLIEQIPAEYKETHLLDDYSHIDYLWADGVWDQVYKPIIQRIKQTETLKELRQLTAAKQR